MYLFLVQPKNKSLLSSSQFLQPKNVSFERRINKVNDKDSSLHFFEGRKKEYPSFHVQRRIRRHIYPSSGIVYANLVTRSVVNKTGSREEEPPREGRKSGEKAASRLAGWYIFPVVGTRALLSLGTMEKSCYRVYRARNLHEVANKMKCVLHLKR